MGGNPRGFRRRHRTPRASGGRNGSRLGLVNEDEILIHPFWIVGTLEDEQVFRADKTMFDAWCEVELGACVKELYLERFLVRWSPQNQPSAFADLETFVFLLVHFEREISALAHDKILFHARVFIKGDDDATPAG